MPSMLRKKGPATKIADALLGFKKKRKRKTKQSEKLLAEETAKIR